VPQAGVIPEDGRMGGQFRSNRMEVRVEMGAEPDAAERPVMNGARNSCAVMKQLNQERTQMHVTATSPRVLSTMTGEPECGRNDARAVRQHDDGRRVVGRLAGERLFGTQEVKPGGCVHCHAGVC